MRRILQFGAFILVLVTVLTPVSEMLDRWDPPGLAHDTEMHLFAVVLMMGLALLVARLIASALPLLLALVDHGPSFAATLCCLAISGKGEADLPVSLLRGSPPLRI